MANPTGSTYLTADNSYLWVDGDVYQIAGPDPNRTPPLGDLIEAAWPGASFNGFGVVNWPHQVLLNKIQQLHNKQLTDENNLTVLENTFSTYISSDIDAGWVKIGSNDQQAGAINIILQMGTVDVRSYALNPNSIPNQFPVTFPIPFSTLVWTVSAFWISVASNVRMGATLGTPDYAYSLGVVTPYGLTASTIYTGMPPDDAQTEIFNPAAKPTVPPGYAGIVGIGWIAMGY
jgi:hypothetical protein